MKLTKSHIQKQFARVGRVFPKGNTETKKMSATKSDSLVHDKVRY